MFSGKPPNQPDEPASRPLESALDMGFGKLLGPRAIAHSSDDIALSAGAQELIKKEEELIEGLLREILLKNTRFLHREFRRIILRDAAASPEVMLKLEAVKCSSSWKEIVPTAREFLRSLDGDQATHCRDIWSLIEYQHQVEEENRKLLTHEIPAGPELTARVREIIMEGEPDFNRLIALLGISDTDFNLEELSLSLDGNRPQVNDTVYGNLMRLIDGETFHWEMDELRELSLALKKTRERGGFPPELLRRFEEIRKAKSPKYLYAFYPPSKSLFIGSAAVKELAPRLAAAGVRKNALEAAMAHAVAHICQEIVEDRGAPGAPPRKLLSAAKELRKTFLSFNKPFMPPLIAKGTAPGSANIDMRALIASPIMQAPSPAQAKIAAPLPPPPPKPVTEQRPLLKGGGLYQLPKDVVKADIPRRKPFGF